MHIKSMTKVAFLSLPFLVYSLLFSFFSHGQTLSGSYTINSATPTGGTNYQSFEDFISDLNTLGVSGPVTVDVQANSGPYNEVLNFKYTTGMGASNPIRINGNGAVVQFANEDTSRQLLILDSVQYLTINDLKFVAQSPTYGWGALITNNSAFDSIINCEFDLSAVSSASAANTNGIVFSASKTSATATGTNGSNCYIANNIIDGGVTSGSTYYAVTVNGNSNNNIIENNEILNFYYYGVYLNGASGTKVINNDINRATKTSVYYFTGIYTTGNTPGTQILKNRIHDPYLSSSVYINYRFYGLHLLGNGNTSNPVLVANNAIYNINAGAWNIYGLYVSSAKDLKIYHNSFIIDQALTYNASTYGCYLTGNNQNTELKNNNVVITGGANGDKYGFYYNSSNSIADAQRNNFYLNSSQSGTQYYGRYAGTNFSTLADFQNAYPAFEVGSHSSDPLLANASSGDLTPSSPYLVGQAEDLSPLITVDIEGQARNTIPNGPTIGAFEAPIPSQANDAGILAYVGPTGVLCNDTQEVSLVIYNNGNNDITGLTVDWTLNGLALPGYTYSDTLFAIQSLKPSWDTVTIGSFVIPRGEYAHLKMWTTLPNNGLDTVNGNDTLTWQLHESLEGVYTINSSLPNGNGNYNSFTDFSNDLHDFGMCGPVIVDVAAGSGPYNEILTFDNVPGNNATNYIRINGNGAVLQFANTATERQMLTLNNVERVTIDNLTFKTLSSAYGWGALITGGATTDSIINCTFDLSSLSGTSADNGNGIMFSASNSGLTAGANGSGCYIANNKILGTTGGGGYYYGIALRGGSNNNLIVNNEIQNFYARGIHIDGATGITISGNDLHRSTKTATNEFYGIYKTGSTNGLKISGNKIHHPYGANGVSDEDVYGIYLTGSATADTALVTNNLIYGMNQGGTVYGIYNTSVTALKIFHNTLDFSTLINSSKNIYGIYGKGTNNGLLVYNNNVSITGGSLGDKYGFYFDQIASVTNLQNNNFYVKSQQAGNQYYGYYVIPCVDLAYFQRLYPNLEQASVSVDPEFVLSSSEDFIPRALPLIGGGLDLSNWVPSDILERPRGVNPNAPTIGAFEVTSSNLTNDAGIWTLAEPGGLYCGGGSELVKVVLNNAGTNQLNSVDIYWSVDGINQPIINYNGILSPMLRAGGRSYDTVSLGLVAIPTNGSVKIKAWTAAPNGFNDANPSNDTLKVTLRPALSGAYTINSAGVTAGSNFKTFADFSSALTQRGICGSVVANVVANSGPYNEQASFGTIKGASAAHTVRINGNGEIIKVNTTAANRPMLVMRGTKYLTINALKFKTEATVYGWGALITGASENDSIINSEFDLSTITGNLSTDGNGIVFSAGGEAVEDGMNGSNCYIGGNTIKGSNGLGGVFYGVAVVGQSENNIITDNTVENVYSIGVYIKNAKGTQVLHNDINRATKTSSSTFYGIYKEEETSGLKIVGNKIHRPFGGTGTSVADFHGIYLKDNALPGAPTLIANNAIYDINQGGKVYGIYISSSPNNNIINNTIDLAGLLGTSDANYGLYLLGNNSPTRVWNNNVSITGGGIGSKYGFYYSSTTSISDAQRNNIYVNSSQTGNQRYGYYVGNYTTMANFRTAHPTLELASTDVNPQYVGATSGDFTPGNAAILQNGLSVANMIQDDINYLFRPASNPTVGAFEDPQANNNDAAMLSLVSPVGLFCPGTQPVAVSIFNAGNNTINSVQLNWSINGVLQTPVTFTQPMAPRNSSNPVADTVVLGNALFPTNGTNVEVRVWTSQPNSQIDANIFNDSLLAHVSTKVLQGVYTLNAANPPGGTNYSSFTELANDLNQYGVCGPVVVNVSSNSGPYNETFKLETIPGASPVNTVRINGNGETLTFSNSTANSSLVSFDGTQYVTLNDLKLKANATNYGWGVRISNGASRDSIINCEIDLSSISSNGANNVTGIAFTASPTNTTSAGTNGRKIYIGHNKIKSSTGSGGAYYGIVLSGFSDSNTVEYNEIENAYAYGIFINGGLGNKVEFNDIHRSTKSSASVFYGIGTAGLQLGTKINGNKIHDPYGTGLTSTSNFYGIQLDHETFAAAHPVLVSNNTVYNVNQGGSVYGIYSGSNTRHDEIYHNTIVLDKSLTANSGNYGIYVTGTNSRVVVKNNIVSITGGGTGSKYGFYYATPTALMDAQRNNIYVNSNRPGAQYYGYLSGNFQTQGDFQTAQASLELASPSVNPQFVNASSGMLMPSDALLFNAGEELIAKVPADILEEPRPLTPTIGAFEKYPSFPNDAGMIALIEPNGSYCAGPQMVKAVIVNTGTASINGLSIRWTVDGVNQPAVAYTDTLMPAAIDPARAQDTVVLGVANFSNSAATEVVAWTYLPNNMPDQRPVNDTAVGTFHASDFVVTTLYDTVCTGHEVVLDLNPNSGYRPGYILWQESIDGLNWNSINNSDTSTYVEPALMTHKWFRAKLGDSMGTCYSNEVKVVQLPIGIVTTTSAERCGPGTVMLQATALPGTRINWYTSTNSINPIATGNSFNTPILTHSVDYWVSSSIPGVAGCESPRQRVKAILKIVPEIDLGNDTLVCAGLMPSMTLDAGNPGGQYLWNTGDTTRTLTVNTTGIYKVTVSLANGCFASDSVTLQFGTVTPLAALPDTINLCAGQSAVLDAGNTGSRYLWNTGDTTQAITVNATALYKVAVTSPSTCSGRDSVMVMVHPYPTVDLGEDTTLCEGAIITLDANNQGNQVLWNTSNTSQTIVVSTPGTYSVTVTGAGNCSVSDTLIIAPGIEPVSVLPNHVDLCEQEAVVLDAGNTGSTYLWNTNANTRSITVDTDGVYTVEIISSTHCVLMDSTSVSVHQNPVVTLAEDTAFCAGDSWTLTLDAGNPGSTYQWNTNQNTQTIQVQNAGVYSVQVLDAFGCKGADTMTITDIPYPVVNLGNDTGFCEGTPFVLYAGNQPSGTTYSWNTGSHSSSILVNQTGTYSVTADNQGCLAEDSIHIIVDPLVRINTLSAFDSTNGRYKMVAWGLQYADTYLWRFGDGSTSTDSSPFHTYQNFGTYKVTLIVGNECGLDSASIYVHYKQKTGLQEVEALAADLVLYPNPARDLVTVENKGPYRMASISVYNALGQLIYTKQANQPNKYQLDVRQLASGVYQVKVEFEGGGWTMKRFEVVQ